jgi:hypothetical protein
MKKKEKRGRGVGRVGDGCFQAGLYTRPRAHGRREEATCHVKVLDEKDDDRREDSDGTGVYLNFLLFRTKSSIALNIDD